MVIHPMKQSKGVRGDFTCHCKRLTVHYNNVPVLLRGILLLPEIEPEINTVQCCHRISLENTPGTIVCVGKTRTNTL